MNPFKVEPVHPYSGGQWMTGRIVGADYEVAGEAIENGIIMLILRCRRCMAEEKKVANSVMAGWVRNHACRSLQEVETAPDTFDLEIAAPEAATQAGDPSWMD